MAANLSNRWRQRFVVAALNAAVLASPAAAQSRVTDSLLKSAKGYELASGVKRDYKQALHLYCQALKKGDAAANYHIGMLYYFGRGVKRDHALAMGWFKRGARKNDHYAQIMLKLHPTTKAKEHDSCRQFDAPMRRHRSVKRKQIESWVRQIAKHYTIDPQLVLAVIEAESGFNANALSPKNAQGLMQLIPSTAKRFGIKNAWDPYQNIKAGTAYLHWLLRHFNGDLKLVLAAYNAGENAVHRYNGIPPYKETQHYVEHIIATYRKTQHPIPPATGT